MEVNYQQISYMTFIGVHSTMHLVHPNECRVCVCVHVSVGTHVYVCTLGACMPVDWTAGLSFDLKFRVCLRNW